MKTALLVGATGLIGGQLLTLLLKNERYQKIIVVTRRPLPISDPKIENLVIDFGALTTIKAQLVADDVYCCLGTTIKLAKTREEFKRVDFEFPFVLAKLCKENGSKQYLLVSALGANKTSSIFYNRVKGETEEAISRIGFRTCHLLRPSLLLGPRTDARAGEGAAKWFYRYLGFIIPKKFEAIESVKIARAMMAFAAEEETGIFIHESSVLQAY